MKAMILCAGFGERLLPLTAELPKPAFPLANLPVVWHTLRLLLAWGVDSVVVNTHHLPDVMTETVRRCRPEGMEVSFSAEKEILGTGGGLRGARGFFLDDEPFILINGDIVTDMDIAGAAEFHLARGAVVTMVLSADDRRKRLGEVKVDGEGRVRSILETPGDPGGLKPAFFTGIHVMSPRIFDYLADRPRSCLVRDCYCGMVAGGEGLFGYFMDSYWNDIGTPAAYLSANMDLLAGAYTPPFEIPMESDEPAGAYMEKPFLIGRETRVGGDVRIGPRAVVGGGAVLEDGCVIRESVVWPGAKVPAGNDLVRAVVGRTTILKI